MCVPLYFKPNNKHFINIRLLLTTPRMNYFFNLLFHYILRNLPHLLMYLHPIYKVWFIMLYILLYIKGTLYKLYRQLCKHIILFYSNFYNRSY